jgi:ATP-dependent Clp protease adaptor protein ClpS
MSVKEQRDTGVIDKEDVRQNKPPMYNVIMINDDFTPMNFVVDVLTGIFNKSTDDANRIMLQVHKSGKGVAGTYTKDIAATKSEQAETFARNEGHPFKLTLEPV